VEQEKEILFSTAQLTATEEASVFHSDTKSGSGESAQKLFKRKRRMAV